MNKGLLVFAVTMGILLSFATASAKQLPPKNTETLTKKLAVGEPITIEDQKEAADLVVWGKVKRVACEKEDWRIWTYATIEPMKYFKGESTGKVIVRYPGGEINNGVVIERETVTIIGGNPEFYRGQEVIVFLLKSETDPWYELLLSAESEYTVSGDTLLSVGGNKMSVQEFTKRTREIDCKDK